jgi:pyruvate, orthophosphate dikinase
MTNLVLPVPLGFTITNEARREFLASRSPPVGLHHEISQHLSHLENEMGKRLGDREDPHLFPCAAAPLYW